MAFAAAPSGRWRCRVCMCAKGRWLGGRRRWSVRRSDVGGSHSRQMLTEEMRTNDLRSGDEEGATTPGA